MKKYFVLILAVLLLTACTSNKTQMSDVTSEITETTNVPVVTSEKPSVTKVTEYVPDYELLPNMRLVDTHNQLYSHEYFRIAGNGRIFSRICNNEDNKTSLFVYDINTNKEVIIPLSEQYMTYYKIKNGMDNILNIIVLDNYEFGEEDNNYLSKRTSYTQDIIK